MKVYKNPNELSQSQLYDEWKRVDDGLFSDTQKMIAHGKTQFPGSSPSELANYFQNTINENKKMGIMQDREKFLLDIVSQLKGMKGW